MKILHVISGNDIGGGGTHVINVCRAPAKYYSATICCIGKGELVNVAKKENIKAFTLSIKEILLGKLNDYIISKSIDLVNFHGPKANVLHLIKSSKVCVPCCVTVHSDYRFDFLDNSFKRMFYTPLSKAALNRFSSFICASDYIRELLEKNFIKGNKYVVYNGIDTNDEKFKHPNTKKREDMGLPKEAFIYLMVARLHPIKNHVNLIHAFKNLHQEYENTRLILVGDGEEENTLRQQVDQLNLNDIVIFMGFKENAVEYMASSDITILTSKNEGGEPPLVILESAMVKKSVICSSIGNLQSIISEEKGYLVEPTDINDIYNKMKKAYEEKESLVLKGEKLYEYICNNFSIENFWYRYQQSYYDILKNEKSKDGD